MMACSKHAPFSSRAIQGRCAKGQTPEFQRTILRVLVVSRVVHKSRPNAMLTIEIQTLCVASKVRDDVVIELFVMMCDIYDVTARVSHTSSRELKS